MYTFKTPQNSIYSWTLFITYHVCRWIILYDRRNMTQTSQIFLLNLQFMRRNRKFRQWVLRLLNLCGRLFICALWSPAVKGLTSWLLFVLSNCECVTFLLVSWVRCGTWLYWFLIFVPLLTFFSQSSMYFTEGHTNLSRETSGPDWPNC